MKTLTIVSALAVFAAPGAADASDKARIIGSWLVRISQSDFSDDKTVLESVREIILRVRAVG